MTLSRLQSSVVAGVLRQGRLVELLKEYAEHAHACRVAAGHAQTEPERKHLLEMAERWEELARQRAAQRHLEDVLAELLKAKNGNHNGGAAAA